MHFEKSRGLYGEDVMPFEARLLADENSKHRWEIQDAAGQTFDRVAELARQGVPAKLIGQTLNVHKSTVSRHLNKARELGVLE